MLSRCFLYLSVGVGAFVIGLSHISSFSFYNNMIKMMLIVEFSDQKVRNVDCRCVLNSKISELSKHG